MIQVYDLGRVPYEEAWRLQDLLAQAIAAGQHPPTLLLLEHPHTYTLGRQGHLENLLWDEATRRRRGVTLHWVDRGGDITYHGPGQLVGYPLLALGRVDARSRLPQADYIGYLRRLEETLIQAVAVWGLSAMRVPGKTGVWLPPKDTGLSQPAKLAAIGVKVDARGISRHGFALNVQPDMTYWQGIIGCGLRDDSVIALADVLPAPPCMSEVKEAVCAAFAAVFGFSLQQDVINAAGLLHRLALEKDADDR